MNTFCKKCGNISTYKNKCYTCLTESDKKEMKNDLDTLLKLVKE